MDDVVARLARERDGREEQAVDDAPPKHSESGDLASKGVKESAMHAAYQTV